MRLHYDCSGEGCKHPPNHSLWRTTHCFHYMPQLRGMEIEAIAKILGELVGETANDVPSS